MRSPPCSRASHRSTRHKAFVSGGGDELAAYVTATSAELAAAAAAIEPVATVADGVRMVVEVVLHRDTANGWWAPPVAAVADLVVGGDPARRVSWIRVYHSLWPLIGAHLVRPPLLEPDPSIVLTGAVADYQRALAAGDLEDVLAAYEPTATVREPSGGPYVYMGTDEIRRIYTLQFANGGGIPLQHCTATDDGAACAIEYSVDRWGSASIPPQAGVAVYVRGTSGRLAAARIYDDVAPPEVSDSSTNQGQR
jgi:hypothetical protein